MYKKLPLLFLICVLALPAFGYVVKKGDTIASIVKKNYNGAIFGKNGGIAKLLSINDTLTEKTYLVPGTIIKLNKELLKPGVVDSYVNTQNDILEDEANYIPDPDSDAAQGLEPYIEIEKYNATNSKTFKAKDEDKLNFFLNFQFNNLTAKKQTTFVTTTLNTSSETEVGLQYSKYMSPKLNVIGSLAVNQFSVADVTTITPPIDQAGKMQAVAKLGFEYLFTDDNFVGIAINYQPHYYLNESAIGHLLLEHLPSPSLSFDTENHFYKVNDLVIGLNFGFEYITNPQNTSGAAANGIAFNLGFIYQQEFKSYDKLRVKFNYNQSNLNSGLYNLTDNALTISFLYSLPY